MKHPDLVAFFDGGVENMVSERHVSGRYSAP
jgi:hypothetical protein